MSSEWQKVPIESICLGIFDGPHATPKKTSNGPVFLGISSLNNGHLDLSSLEYLSEEDFNKWTKRVTPKAGDIVFSYETRLGQAAVIPPGLRCCLGRRMALMRVNPDKAIPDYLLYAYLGPEFQEVIRQRTIHGSTVDRIPLLEFGSFPISVPPLDVQKEVVGVLRTLDDRMTLLRETSITLEAIAQALFKSWFVDFDPVRAKLERRVPESMDEATAAMFPDEFEESELGLVPKGWRVMPFLEACDLQGGAQPPASTFTESENEGYVRLLQIRDFSTDAHKTYIPDTAKLKKVTEDDVLIGRYGSASGDKSKDSLGRVCRGLSGAYNVALMKLSPIEVGREFALQMVNDPRFYDYLQRVSSKAVQSGFSKSELRQYKVVVPPAEIAERFESIGFAIWSQIKATSGRQRELSNLRDLMLPRLISGRLRLPDVSEALMAA